MENRLAKAIEFSGMTQAEVANLVGVSQGIVSQWLSGKKQPSRDNVDALARVLGTAPEWLLYGRGEGPSSKGQGRDEYEPYWGWRFRPQPDDGGRDYGNANIWSFAPTIESLVREAFQNIGDVQLGTNRIDARVRLIRLRGAQLKRFLDSIHWAELRRHLDASTANTQKLGQLIRYGLDKFDGRDELLLLRIDDFGTTGLIGPEEGTGNFAALCRNNLDSAKQIVSAGGAFGLGKAAFWRTSLFSTVLFNSNLSQAEPDGQDNRIIGKTELPWHEIGNERFAGPGWLGKVSANSSKAVSYFGNATLAEDSFLEREKRSGTSILVIGFHDPSSDEDKEPAVLANEIKRAIVDYFWPAIGWGKLSVVVETCEGREITSSQIINSTNLDTPYMDMLEKETYGETSEQLSGEGDVVQKSVPLAVPARRVDPVHPRIEHESKVLVRRASDDPEESRLNELAIFRGTGMVVKYSNLSNLCVGALPFHAAVLCGEAAGDDNQDKAADEFLRTAEPPQHNTWTTTAELKTLYATGGGIAIQRHERHVREAIRNLVRPASPQMSDGPRSLKELLTLGEVVTDPPNRPRISRARATVEKDGSWLVDATIRVPAEAMGWDISPVIVFNAETGGGQVVEWKELEARSNCSVEGGALRISPGVREASFKGRSDANSHPVPASESTVTIELRRAAKRGDLQ